MAPYDSDSSGGDDDEYTETNVLLGYASKEASDDTISHLGGKPVSHEVKRHPRHCRRLDANTFVALTVPLSDLA